MNQRFASIIAACILAAPPPKPAAAEPQSLDDIASAIEAGRSDVRSLVVTYQTRGKPLISRAELLRMGIVGLYDDEGVSGMAGPKTYLSLLFRNEPIDVFANDFGESHPDIPPPISLEVLLQHMPATELAKALDSMPPQEETRTLVYDGRSIGEKLIGSLSDFGVKRDVNTITAPEPRQFRYIPTGYLDLTGFGAEDPCRCNDGQLGSIPALLRREDAAIRPATTDIDGAKYIQVRIGENQELWLDPGLGYAVRKRTFSANGAVTLELVMGDFATIAPGVSFPRKIDRHSWSDGRQILHLVDTVTKIELNEPSSAKLFEITPSIGSFVIDKTRQPLDPQGNPVARPSGDDGHITYIQPAEGASVEDVAREAQRSYGDALLVQSQQQRWRYALIVIGAAVAVVLGGVLTARAYRNRVA